MRDQKNERRFGSSVCRFLSARTRAHRPEEGDKRATETSLDESRRGGFIHEPKSDRHKYSTRKTKGGRVRRTNANVVLPATDPHGGDDDETERYSNGKKIGEFVSSKSAIAGALSTGVKELRQRLTKKG